MIELNKKTQQDFLNREFAQKLLDEGVDMSDSKYLIIKKQSSIEIKEGKKPKVIKKDYVVERRIYTELMEDAIPTFTLSELMNLLDDNAGIAKEYGLWFAYDNWKSHTTRHYDYPIDACFEMICWLKERRNKL